MRKVSTHPSCPVFQRRLIRQNPPRSWNLLQRRKSQPSSEQLVSVLRASEQFAVTNVIPERVGFLDVVPYGKQLRIPKQQDWAKIARELKNLGKASHASPGRIFKREMGWGNPRRDRDAKLLRLALDLQRRRRKQRLSKQLQWQLEKVGKMAQIIAAKYPAAQSLTRRSSSESSWRP